MNPNKNKIRWIAVGLVILTQLIMFLKDNATDNSLWLIAIGTLAFIAFVFSPNIKSTFITAAFCYLVSPFLLILGFSTTIVKASLGGSSSIHGRIMEVMPTILSYFPISLLYTILPMIFVIVGKCIFAIISKRKESI